jgi:hypothetical protein
MSWLLAALPPAIITGADSYSGDDGVAIAAYNDPKTLHSLSPNLQAETFIVSVISRCVLLEPWRG